MRCASGSIRSSSTAMQLMPSDVIAAIQAQNTQVAAGQIGGQPAPDEQMLNATVTAQSRLTDARAVPPDPSQDAARRLDRAAAATSRGSSSGAENYGFVSRAQRPSRRRASRIKLAPGADALDDRRARSRRRSTQLAKQLPAGRQGRLPATTRTAVHQAVDRGGRQDADRGDRPRRHRHVRVPAELARDADPDDRGAGRAARHVRRARASPASRSTR